MPPLLVRVMTPLDVRPRASPLLLRSVCRSNLVLTSRQRAQRSSRDASSMVVELWSAIHPSTAASSEPNAVLTISGSSLWSVER